MNNPIKKLSIQNFKSIKNAELDCERINVILGRPNVGKSNLLEALTVYEWPEFITKGIEVSKDIIRYNTGANLFYFQNTSKPVKISSNIGSCRIYSDNSANGTYHILFHVSDGTFDVFENREESNFSWFRQNVVNFDYSSFKPQGIIPPFSIELRDSNGPGYSGEVNNRVKRYEFKRFQENDVSKSFDQAILNAPNGDNIFSIIKSNHKLAEKVGEYFSQYNLDFALTDDGKKRSFQIQRKISGIIVQIPFNLTADTLQRIIFHMAAIETNKNSIILLEEPEAHSFPKYTDELAETIGEEKENQYFITTHSPYLVSTLLNKNIKNEVAFFVAEYSDHQTNFKRLSDTQIEQMYNAGSSLFYNLDAFVG